jgi:hypothetical protein
MMPTTETWYSGLIEPTETERRFCNALMKVKAINARDYPNWESRLLDPDANPIPHMRAQRQTRNDCQGQALANGEEKRQWYVTGKMWQLADIYAYNASEYFGRPQNVGRDQGTSIQSGVGVLTRGLGAIGVAPGLPLESDWPYDSYERSSSNFARRASAVDIDQTWVSEHGELPDWEGMLVGLAAGGSGHIGTYWPPRWSQIGARRLMDTLPRGGGGHATEIIWAVRIDGVWYLVVWNSHGDQYYLMSRKCYEQMQRTQAQPFGGYLLLPDKPEERFVDWRKESPWTRKAT